MQLKTNEDTHELASKTSFVIAVRWCAVNFSVFMKFSD